MTFEIVNEIRYYENSYKSWTLNRIVFSNHYPAIVIHKLSFCTFYSDEYFKMLVIKIECVTRVCNRYSIIANWYDLIEII